MALGELILRGIAEVDPEDLRKFICGSPSLDEFLHDQALEYGLAGLTQTTVVYLEGEAYPAAYFSLSADHLKLSDMEIFELGLESQVPITAFPAVKITRLAVSASLQSRGVGEALIDLIEGIIFASQIGVRLITVDADDNLRTVNFYRRLKFVDSSVNASHRRNDQASRRATDRPEQATISLYKDIYLD